ncbi:SDR family oxidoreductase [Sorangium sp. So ce429]
MIAGASSGIGEAFARRLGADGMDLILVARRGELLQALGNEIEKKHKVRVETLVADLAAKDDLARLEEKAAQTPRLEILVNCAANCRMGAFSELDPDLIEYQVRLNVMAPLRLTRAALPRMIERNSGAVINVSSIGGLVAAPHGATYCGSKAFLIRFTEAVASEVYGTRVQVQALCPGLTRTDFPDIAGMNTADLPDSAWMRPEAVVDASMRALKRDTVLCIPGFANRVLPKVMNSLPRGVAQWLGRRASGSAS